MAVEWHYIGGHMALGVDWHASEGDTSASVAPTVHRYDEANTNNYGGRYSEALSPDPVGGGPWSGLSFGKGYGERQLDSFSTRTYAKGSGNQIVTLTISWENIGTYYSGSFHSLGSGSSSWTYTVRAIEYRAPYNPKDVSATRASDNRNDISWGQEGTDDYGLYPWKGFYVDRSVDGGSWSRLATVSLWSTYDYADTTTAANHSYRYRVSAYGPGGTSGVVYTDTLYNTPCAPSFTSVSRKAETTIEAELENDAKTATAMEVQRSADKPAWVDVGTFDGTVTSFEDTPGGGTWYYRARNTRGSLASEWAYSEAVVTICAPAAPTLRSPASSATVKKSDASITFQWAHNAIDGSAQTAAQLRYSTDGGSTYTTVSVSGSAQSRSVSNSFAVNSTVTWSVRTKGAHEDWGPWAGNRVLYVRQVPTVTIEQPGSGFVVEDVPIHVKLAYSDPSGKLANVKLSVSCGGATVYEVDMGTSLERDIGAADFLPEDGATYVIAATARSSSTLTSSATRTVSVDFTPPEAAYLSVRPDAETGFVDISVGLAHGSSSVDADHIDLYRVADGSRVLIAANVPEGSVVRDKYAPVNVPYSYEAVTGSDSGAVSSAVFDGELVSPWWFMYFGEDVAKGMWDPEYSFKKSRPSKARELFAGRRWPVSYDDQRHTSQEGTVSAILMTREERMAFDRLVESGGRCVFKSGDGDVFHADVDVEFSPRMRGGACWGTATVSFTRIDGDAL